MRNTILYIASSLDGYIARKNGDVDWLQADDTFDFAPFQNSVDTVIMGYGTYQKSLTFEGDVFGGKKYYVFTDQHRDSDDPRVSFISADPGSFVKQLRGNPGKDIWLMGGGILNAAFLKARAIDSLYLFYLPLLLGEGIPLFNGKYPQTQLNLVQHQSYPSGMVELQYKVLQK